MVDMVPRNSPKKNLKKIMLRLRAAATPIFRASRNREKIKISKFCPILTCLVSKYMFFDTRNRLKRSILPLDQSFTKYLQYCIFSVPKIVLQQLGEIEYALRGRQLFSPDIVSLMLTNIFGNARKFPALAKTSKRPHPFYRIGVTKRMTLSRLLKVVESSDLA